MSAFLRKLEPYIFVLFRITTGGLFLFHGLQKIFGLYGGTQVEYLSRLGAAGFIELVGGTLIALGAWTVPLAMLASGEMAAAYYLGHSARATWPIQNGGEPAALFCAAFLYIATHGPGTLSVDALMKRR